MHTVLDYASPNKDRNRVYSWGCSKTGALGVRYIKQQRLLSTVRHPRRLGFAEKYNVRICINTYKNNIYWEVFNSDKCLHYTKHNFDIFGLFGRRFDNCLSNLNLKSKGVNKKL